MCRLITILALLLSVVAADAESFAKEYISHGTGDGAVYFVKPRKMQRDDDSRAAKALLYDMTHVVGSDTVSYTVSIVTKDAFRPDSVSVLMPDGQILKKPLEKIYIEPGKSIWTARMRFYLSCREFYRLYSGVHPFRLAFCHAADTASFHFKDKDWTKTCALIHHIITLINLNTTP